MLQEKCGQSQLGREPRTVKTPDDDTQQTAGDNGHQKPGGDPHALTQKQPDARKFPVSLVKAPVLASEI